MDSTSVRTALMAVLLMIASTFSVALVADSATAAGSYRVKLNVSDSRPDVGETVRLSGKVKPAAPGKRVAVQAKAAGTGWVTLSRTRLTRSSTYRAVVRFNHEGRVSLRVVKAGTRRVAQGVSRVRELRVGERSGSPEIVTTSLPEGEVGAAYSARVRTADDRAGSFAVSSGDLPPGLSIDDQTGFIRGTPTTQGTSSFEVTFTDLNGRSDSQPLSITVGPAGQSPQISTTSLPSGQVGVAYAATLETVGNRTGSWSVIAGSLPPGLTLATATGKISGTPSAQGTFPFTVKFTETGTGRTDTQDLSIAIAPAGAPIIATNSLPHGVVDTPYSARLRTVGDRQGTWSIQPIFGGRLPAGLSLNGATGEISGRPTTTGTSTFTVTFTAANGGGSASKSLSITIDRNSSPPVISTTSLPGGVVDHSYSATLRTVGDRSGTWALSSGALPTGLALNSASGVISGTPRSAGTSRFTVVFTANDGLTDSQALSITIDPNRPPEIEQTTLPDGRVGVAYRQQLTTVGNRAGTWSLAGGRLPSGLTLTPDGLIRGTPTSAGTSNFSVLFTAAGGQTDTQALSIRVVP